MKSIGYGAYDGSLGSAAGLLPGVNAFFEPVEVLEPAELKGAMLSRGFKIEKIKVGESDQYKILPNFGPLSALVVALPAELSKFAGINLDPSKPFEMKIIGHSLVYVPPKKDYKMMAIAAAIAIVVIIGLVKL